MLTKKTKYALKALLALARESDEPIRAAVLSKRERIPRKFAEVILFEMTRMGIVRSQKGPGGGYFLAKDPHQIAIGPLLRAWEGPFAPVPCVSETAYERCDDCPDEQSCSIRLLMQEVRDATAQVLDGATLADMAGMREVPSASSAVEAVASGPLLATLRAFGKSPALIVHKASPLNGGPSPELLPQNHITPQSLFFVRNHGTVPRIDPETYHLEIAGLVQRPMRFSLDELRERFEEVTLEASLMCAGNRRQEFDDIRPIRGEVPWGAEAVSNATWTGVRLRDVLEHVGLKTGARHAAFEAYDEVSREGRTFGFGGSIPIHKARAEEALLAYQMNGQPLPATHGFPLRAVVPGFIGARSVKWLRKIKIQKEPSQNFFQTQAYKLFPPHVRPETVNWEHGQMLGELFTTAAVCSPVKRAMDLPAGELELRGYALGGDGRTVTRVEVSLDDGQSWLEAGLQRGSSAWAWCLWQCRVNVPSNASRIWVRAWDDNEVQPPFAADLWNFKGYMNNSWYCLRNTAVR